jgi:hypothetical protein
VAGVSSVVIKIGAETAQAVSAIRDVDKSLDKTASSGDKLQAGLKKAAIPAAAALTALAAAAISSAKAAASAQASRERLDAQMVRSTGATDAVVKANEDWLSSMSAVVTFSAGDMRDALGNLVRATGSVQQSQELLNLAMDTSAATGKSLSSVSSALAKAYGGSYGSLKRLVPSLDDAAIKSKDFAKVQEELNKQVEGAAKGEAQTAAGQYEMMQKSIKGLQVQIGTGLLPIIQQVLPVVTELVRALAGHPDAILAAGAAIGVLAGAILAANAAISVYNTLTTIQTILTESQAIKSAIATARMLAYTAAMLVYRGAVMAVRAASIAWTAVQIALNVALSANPIGLIVVAVAALTVGIILAYRHSATFRNIVQDAFRVAKDNILLLLGPMGLMIKAFIELYQHSATVRAIVTGTFNAIYDAIKRLLDLVGQLIAKLGSIHVPHISLPGLNMASASTTSAAMRGVSSYAAPVASGGVVINITGAIDPESTAKAVRRAMARYDRRRGTRPLGGQGDYTSPDA